MMPSFTSSPATNEMKPLVMPAMVRPRGAARFANREEPKLSELLDDPIMRRLMASDGVHLAHLIDVVSDARAKLAGR